MSSRTITRWAAVLACGLAAAITGARTSSAGAAAHPSRAAAPPATGGPRPVHRPHVPPPCRLIPAQLSTATGTFTPAVESAAPDTARIQRALDACAGSGRAVELIPSRDGSAFLAAPLDVRAGEFLVVAGGATLYATRDAAAYQIPGATTCGTIAGDGNGCVPFIDLTGSHAGVMGTRGPRGERGIIDGRGEMTMLGSSQTWWDVAEQAKSGGNQNNPKLIQSKGADDLTVYDVELANAAMYHLLITDGHGLTVWDTIVDTPAAGARNTDGIDPDSESDVTLAHDFVQDGDDCIAIKSDPGIPADDITVRDVRCYGTHGISIGSQTAGGVANVLVDHATISGTDSLGNVSTSNNGIRIKSDALVGGITQQVSYEDICETGVQNPLYFNPFYAAGGSDIPTFRDILLDGVVAVDSPPGTASLFEGFDAAHPLQLDMAHVRVDDPAQSASHARIGLQDSNVVPAGADVIDTPIRIAGHLPHCRFRAFPAAPVQ